MPADNSLGGYHTQTAPIHSSWERTEARDGSSLDTRRYTSTYTNTDAVSELTRTISNLQFERYQRRGGRLTRGDHTRGHRFNSPNIHLHHFSPRIALRQSSKKTYTYLRTTQMQSSTAAL